MERTVLVTGANAGLGRETVVHLAGLGFGVVGTARSAEKLVAIDKGRLVLRAQMRPLAVNRVVFTLRPVGAGTEVEVEEYAMEGPAAWLWNPAFEGLMWLRNAETLRRLKELAERRHALATAP